MWGLRVAPTAPALKLARNDLVIERAAPQRLGEQADDPEQDDKARRRLSWAASQYRCELVRTRRARSPARPPAVVQVIGATPTAWPRSAYRGPATTSAAMFATATTRAPSSTGRARSRYLSGQQQPVGNLDEVASPRLGGRGRSPNRAPPAGWPTPVVSPAR